MCTEISQSTTETGNRFQIQLKASYGRIRKNVIIKNIDYWKAGGAIERSPVHLFIR
jgi:hypothetical protein